MDDLRAEHLEVTAAVEQAYSSGLIPAVQESSTFLASDIDNTFICHEGHEHSLTSDSHLLADTLQQRSFGAVLITGAAWSKESGGGTAGVVQRMEASAEESSIIPSNVHAIFTGGGLEGYVRSTEGSFLPDVVYEQFIEEKKVNFNQALVEATAADFLNRINTDFARIDITPLFEDEITFVPVSEVAVFQHLVKDGDGIQHGKVSMYFHAETDEQFRQITAVAEEYALRSGAECVICEEKDINNRLNRRFEGNPPVKRYNVDFTAVTKSTPIEYIAERLKAAGANDFQAVVAGDAGNDSPMFLSPYTTHGVIVGGAAKELQSHADTFRSRGVEVYQEERHCIGPNSIAVALEQFFPSDPFDVTGMSGAHA
jgi:hydroxymethylpyrimidine pyrophosphatase-like HAD family hydrolase